MQTGRKAARVQRKAAQILKLEPIFSKYPIVRRLYKDTFYLAVMLVYPVTGLNLAYAIAYAIMGITKLSPWHELLAVYYLTLSFMRVDVIRTDIVTNGLKREVDKRYIWKRYFDVGALLTIMSIVLFAAVAMLTRSEGGARYTGWFIYVMAVYTCYKIISATANLLKSRRSATPLLSIIRRIKQADALLSVLSLQTALLAAFDDGTGPDPAIANGITGSIVCMIILGIGVGMLARAHTNLIAGRTLRDIPFYRMAKDRAARKQAREQERELREQAPADGQAQREQDRADGQEQAEGQTEAESQAQAAEIEQDSGQG